MSFFKTLLNLAPVKRYSFKTRYSRDEIAHNIHEAKNQGNLAGFFDNKNFKLIGKNVEIGMFSPIFLGTLKESEGQLGVFATASMLAKTRTVINILTFSVLTWMAYTTVILGQSIYFGDPNLKLLTLLISGVFMLQAVKEVSALGWNSSIAESEQSFLDIFN